MIETERFVTFCYFSAHPYDYNYDEEEFEDVDEGVEYEEADSGIIPRFTTNAQHFKVPAQHSIRMPCRVDNLGHMVVSWKKVDPRKPSSMTYLSTGKHKLVSDARISLEEVNERGSTLVLDQVSEADIGDYVCEVSSTPPATLRHELSISVPPTVQILKPNNGIYKINSGEELALVCHGTGDPEPVLKWKREVYNFV